jgi:Ni,Fe-hydrogenase III large subunit
MQVYDIRIDHNEGILNAGKIIGETERIISLTFLLSGAPEAVGFVIAGKSILRFRDTDTIKTEYVLVGTLLSFTIAILAGVAINILKNKFLIPLSTP